MLNLVPQLRDMRTFVPSEKQGFVWWYVDLVGDDGTGIVLIWGLRNPFLPISYAGDLGPSVSIVIYERGQKVFNLHQVHDVSEYKHNGYRWSVGQSTFEWTRRFGRGLLTVKLDCPIPGTDDRLTGDLTVWGNDKKRPSSQHESASLGWCHFVVDGSGEGSLRWGDHLVAVTGRAYFDTNGSQSDITDIGIQSWCWGRLTSPSRSYIWFDTNGTHPETLLLSTASQSEIASFPGHVDLNASGRTRFGTDRATSVDVTIGEETLHLVLGRPVETGPFYQRYLVECSQQGERFEGVVERVFVDRMDLPIWNRLVPMAIHRVAGRNSHFLPFFSGPLKGRWGRLLRLLSTYFFRRVS